MRGDRIVRWLVRFLVGSFVSWIRGIECNSCAACTQTSAVMVPANKGPARRMLIGKMVGFPNQLIGQGHVKKSNKIVTFPD